MAIQDDLEKVIQQQEDIIDRINISADTWDAKFNSTGGILSGLLQISNFAIIDNTSKRIGIGTITPASILDVAHPTTDTIVNFGVNRTGARSTLFNLASDKGTIKIVSSTTTGIGYIDYSTSDTSKGLAFKYNDVDKIVVTDNITISGKTYFTQPVYLANGASPLSFDDTGQKVITWNDDSGNFVIRTTSVFDSEDKYILTNSGATKIVFNSENLDGRIIMSVAERGVQDNVITYNNNFELNINQTLINSTYTYITSNTFNLNTKDDNASLAFYLDRAYDQFTSMQFRSINSSGTHARWVFDISHGMGGIVESDPDDLTGADFALSRFGYHESSPGVFTDGYISSPLVVSRQTGKVTLSHDLQILGHIVRTGILEIDCWTKFNNDIILNGVKVGTDPLTGEDSYDLPALHFISKNNAGSAIIFSNNEDHTPINGTLTELEIYKWWITKGSDDGGNHLSINKYDYNDAYDVNNTSTSKYKYLGSPLVIDYNTDVVQVNHLQINYHGLQGGLIFQDSSASTDKKLWRWRANNYALKLLSLNDTYDSSNESIESTYFSIYKDSTTNDISRFEFGSSTQVRLEIQTPKLFFNNTQVLTTRQTGWTNLSDINTGNSARDLSAISSDSTELAKIVRSIVKDLNAHGLIGS